MKREDTYYQAMLTRDHRFDGKFFVGVKTTGIYCRPICPARPRRENVEFFASAIESERAGYRPCLRCRPESAPRSPAWVGKSAVVRRAIKMLQARDTMDLDEDQFAAYFGVTARHLRRLFQEEVGKTPKQLSFENRLNLARKLIVETRLSLAEVSGAAGFKSIRRFNDAFKLRFKKSPGQIRRAPLSLRGMVVSLPYRPPFDFEGLMHSYRNHRVGDLEWFDDDRMHRLVEIGGQVGEVVVANDPEHCRLLVEIDFPDSSALHLIISRVRSVFDLDSDPVVVANSLELDSRAKALLKKYPGVRLPSGWDPFEIAIGTVLGQLVSVERGRALLADLIELTGREVKVGGRTVKLFPSPERLAAADLKLLKSTGARKRTIKALARAVSRGEISLEPTQDVDEFVAKVMKIPGIGPWTASYMALKVLRHTDAFPETDLILSRALELHSKESISRMSPWRGYAAALFWRAYTEQLRRRA